MFRSPDLVIVDSQVIADAPVEFLVSGMGDAMATYYEARAVERNTEARTWIHPLTYRPPRIARAIAGEACLITRSIYLFLSFIHSNIACLAGFMAGNNTFADESPRHWMLLPCLQQHPAFAWSLVCAPFAFQQLDQPLTTDDAVLLFKKLRSRQQMN